MVEPLERRQSTTFVVKVFGEEGAGEEAAQLTGQVQHVVTGEKYRFQGLAELGAAITRLNRRDMPAG